MPKILNITIPDFLGKPLSCRPNPGVNYLAGENGSGKTYLLQVIFDWFLVAGRVAMGSFRMGDFAKKLGVEIEVDGAVDLRENHNVFLGMAPYDDDIWCNDRKSMYTWGNRIPWRQLNEIWEPISGRKNLLFLREFCEEKHDCVFLLDTPDLALSIMKQCELFQFFGNNARENGNQFIIATHSSVVMSGDKFDLDGR